MATTDDTPDTNPPTNKQRKSFLWWLIPLIILLGLVGYLLSRSGGDDKTESSKNQSNSSQSATAQSNGLKAQFEAAIPKDQRTILFVADTANPEDPAGTDAALSKIADFYKAHNQLQLIVNGSIFNGQPGDKNEQLAQERAQKIKQQLIAKGVSGGHIEVTAQNTYKGNTDAAKAAYARSVTVDAL